MIESFAALFLAHMVSVFLIPDVAGRDDTPMARGLWAARSALFLALATLLLGAWHMALIGLGVVHLVLRLIRRAAPQTRLLPFVLEQITVLAACVGVSVAAPDLWSSGLWAHLKLLPGAFAIAAGLIAATSAGGQAIGLLLNAYEAPDVKAGLPHGGRLIGLLERSMIFLLIFVGQPAGVGFLIAAKSILRFEDTRESKVASEYIIIGTLASFAWAMACAWATLALLSMLPPIGIFPQTP